MNVLKPKTAGMATKRPTAVATRASAIPGATVASETLFISAMAENECMIPHTVPNRPMKGAVLPVVAKSPNDDLSFSISSETAKRNVRCMLASIRRSISPVFARRLYSVIARSVMVYNGEISSAAMTGSAFDRSSLMKKAFNPSSTRRLAWRKDNHFPHI